MIRIRFGGCIPRAGNSQPHDRGTPLSAGSVGAEGEGVKVGNERALVDKFPAELVAALHSRVSVVAKAEA